MSVALAFALLSFFLRVNAEDIERATTYRAAVIAPVEHSFELVFSGQESRNDLSGHCYVYALSSPPGIAFACLVDRAPGAIAFTDAEIVLLDSTGTEERVFKLSANGILMKGQPTLVLLYASDVFPAVLEIAQEIRDQTLLRTANEMPNLKLKLNQVVIK